MTMEGRIESLMELTSKYAGLKQKGWAACDIFTKLVISEFCSFKIKPSSIHQITFRNDIHFGLCQFNMIANT
jgi:hypothetical protein